MAKRRAPEVPVQQREGEALVVRAGPEGEQVNDEREIEIALKSGDFLFLPVVNDTEGLLDIHLVANFLEAAVTGYENLQELGDLIAKLKAEVEQRKSDPHTDSDWLRLNPPGGPSVRGAASTNPPHPGPDKQPRRAR